MGRHITLFLREYDGGVAVYNGSEDAQSLEMICQMCCELCERKEIL
jgi:hypothetical protein